MSLLRERSVLLARPGYLFTASLTEAERRRLYGEGAVAIRLLGRPALLVTGAEGVRFFYDESRLMRLRAVPAPIALSLFGSGAVHGLDDADHRHRKELFLAALTEPALDRLTDIAQRRLERRITQWEASGGGEVFANAVDVFGSSIIEWAGIDEPDAQKSRHARWLSEIVDGFGTVGRPYARAALARRRCDRWAADLVRRERETHAAPADSWLSRVARFEDADGQPLPERTAAVELLNILRPTVAVAWLASFAALALVEHPQWRERIRDEVATGGSAVAEAFCHEVRRYYPFVPVLAARAKDDTEFAGHRIAAGQRVLLDVHGTNHGADWEDPWAFRPERFLDVDPCDVEAFVPQGGGPRETGHRCPGEGVANRLLELTVRALATRDSLDLPAQDRTYSARRMPTRPASGTRVTL